MARFRPKTSTFLRARHHVVNETQGGFVTAMDGKRHISRAPFTKTLCGRAAVLADDARSRPRCSTCKRIANP